MKYKNILLGLGSFATIVAPISTIVACGEKDEPKRDNLGQKKLSVEQTRINALTSNSPIRLSSNAKVIEWTTFDNKVAALVGIDFNDFNEELFAYTYRGTKSGVTIKAKSKIDEILIIDVVPVVIEVVYPKFSNKEQQSKLDVEQARINALVSKEATRKDIDAVQDVETSFTSEVATLVGINFEKFNEELFKYTYQGLSDGVKIKATLKDKTSLSSINDFIKILVEYVKLTDQEKLVNIKTALEALDTTSKTKEEFDAIAFVNDDASSMLNSATITTLGITYAIPIMPDGIKIQITKVVNEATIAFSITSTSETIAITGTITITKFVSQINRDILDVKTLIQNMANNGQSVSTPIDKVENAVFNEITATALGLVWWNEIINDAINAKKIVLTYSHDGISANGGLSVQIKIAKLDGETQNVDINVAIAGIDEAKVNQDISDVKIALEKITDSTKTISTPINAVIQSADVIFSTELAAKLGIFIPTSFDHKGTTLTYSHSIINNDDKYEVSVYVNKNSETEQIAIIETTIGGFDDASTQAMIEADSSDILEVKNALEQIDNSKLELQNAIRNSGGPFVKANVDSLGIDWDNKVLPINFQGTTVSFYHNGINADGNLFVKIKISKGQGVVQNANIIVAVTGIDEAKANNEIARIKRLLDGTTIMEVIISNISGITPVASDTNFTEQLATSLGFTFNDLEVGDITKLTYSHNGIFRDGILNVIVKISIDGQYQTTTLGAKIIGINNAKVNQDISDVKAALEDITGSTKTISAPINAVIQSADVIFSTELAAKLGIFIPTIFDHKGTILTYSHLIINDDDKYEVRVYINKDGKTEQTAIIETTISGFADASTQAINIANSSTILEVKNALEQIVDSKLEAQNAISGSSGAFTQSNVENLGIDWDEVFDNIQGTILTYSHSGIIANGNLYVSIKIAKGQGVAQYANIIVTVTGIDEAKANDEIARIKRSIDDTRIISKNIGIGGIVPVYEYMNFNVAAAASLGLTFPRSLATSSNDIAKLTYRHNGISANGSLIVTIKIIVGEQSQTTTLTAIIAGINEAKVIQDIKSVQDAFNAVAQFSRTFSQPIVQAVNQVFNDAIMKKFGIVLPLSFGSQKGTTLTYSHDAINISKLYAFVIHINKNGATGQTVTINIDINING